MTDVRLIALDVDGTLTDGKLYYSSSGDEVKAFNVKDGLAISQAVKVGYEVALITGRTSDIVTTRAKELGIKHVYQGIHSKAEVLNELCEKLNYDIKNVLFVGDDINDLEAMKVSGYSACPKDAAIEVIKQADFISEFNGGEGAVREILVNLLQLTGHWGKITIDYSGGAQ